jgi:hypothetical protein
VDRLSILDLPQAQQRPKEQAPSLITSEYASNSHQQGPKAKNATKGKLPTIQSHPIQLGPPLKASTTFSDTAVTENVIQAHESILRAKESNSLGKGVLRKLLRGSGNKGRTLSDYYHERDIVSTKSHPRPLFSYVLQAFLIDNAGSMAPYWDEVTFLLATLVAKAEKQDADGIRLRFTCSDGCLQGPDKVKRFRETAARAMPQKGYKTDMSLALKKALSPYLRQWYYRHKFVEHEPRDRTIIVFTDGLWEGMTDHQQVFSSMVEFYEQFTLTTGRKLGPERPEVSIEFIQFGDDVDASARLRRLDDDMGLQGIP